MCWYANNLAGDVTDIENTAALEFDIKAKTGTIINSKVEQFNKRFPEMVSHGIRYLRTCPSKLWLVLRGFDFYWLMIIIKLVKDG